MFRDSWPTVPRVATSFPRLTRVFFAHAGLPVRVALVSGSAEIAPHVGIADIVVNLASTGATLRTNGMREVATVMASSARLVTALDRVRTVLPGLNGPTVIDTLNGGLHVAMHAVVDASAIYRTIAALKALGGEGILVTRIERLVP